MKDGERMVFDFSSAQVTVHVGTSAPQVLASKPFAQQLLSVWLGKAAERKA